MIKITLLYESYFGNTFEIAKIIGDALNKMHETEIRRISETTWEEVSSTDLLIMGSPTRGFRPCEKTMQFLKSIPVSGLTGKKVAAFDTRIYLPSIKSKFLRFMVSKGGYAAKQIAKSLKKSGGDLVVSPEGFLVSGEKGPLTDGEQERASAWAQKLLTFS
jgi:flavodoxin